MTITTDSYAGDKPLTRQRSAELRVYSTVTALGVAIELAFAAVALFAPDMLSLVLSADRVEFSYVWLGNLGMLLFARGLLSLAILRDPVRLSTYAWLSALGQMLTAIYWLTVVARLGSDFLPWLVVPALLALVPAALLQRSLPAGARMLVARTPRNVHLLWFRRIMVLGLWINAGFILPAWFAPALLRPLVGAQLVELTAPWLGAVAATLAALSVLYVPVLLDPERAPVMSWLAVAARFIAAAFWISVATQPGRGAFWGYFAADATLGLALAFLLQAGSSPETRLSIAALRLPHPSAAVRGIVLVAALAATALGSVGWYYFVRQVPDAEFSSAEERFKYGVIGLGPAARIPLYVWQVMPELCPESIGERDRAQGWNAFGFIFEPGHDTPIGFARREIGYPSLEPNCALCHTGTYRESTGDAPHVLPGAPAHALDLERFQRFLYSCAASPNFSGEKVVEAMARRRELNVVERSVYRFGIVPVLRASLIRQHRDFAWQDKRPDQGRGRTDTFNPTKINVFHLADDGTTGTTDLPAVWNQAPRERLALHWDGNNTKIRERNFAAAMAVGATPHSVQTASFSKVTNYLLQLPAAKYPFPIDADKAARGARIYARECAHCHAFDGRDVAQVTPVDYLGTDRHRLDSFSKELVTYFHAIDAAPFHFDAYRKTDGYTNLPLDGIWARAPYLHHGAVPTLTDLLSPPAERPRRFYRGYDVYDRTRVGFVSEGQEAAAHGYLYDVTVPGNSNEGHLYGTQLAPDQRDALVEYLKTL